MLKVGVNWLSPYTLPTVRRLLDEGIADFCEIMVDNAVHLSAEKIHAALPGVPLALHIVTSNFLTKSSAELQDVAQHLQPWIAELQPLYVSDHLPQLNYKTDFAKTCARVREWQSLLDVKLLLENLPSMSVEGAGQAEFYARLLQETHSDLLFDFSNAYIAEYNGAQSHADWKSLIEKTTHFHVAGFRIDPATQLATDTHDAPIADEVFAMMQPYFTDNRERTIVFELDTNPDYELAKQQIIKLRPLAHARGSVIPDADIFTYNQSRARERAVERSGSDPLVSFVTEWSLRGLDHINAKGIIMRTKAQPDLAVGLWKSTEPDQPAKIVTLNISAAKLPPADAYAISYTLDSWAGVEWVELVDFK